MELDMMQEWFDFVLLIQILILISDNTCVILINGK